MYQAVSSSTSLYRLDSKQESLVKELIPGSAKSIL